MNPNTKALYAELAAILGLDELTPNADGGVQLNVGDESVVLLFAEDAETLMVVSPVVDLPIGIDHGQALWLLRRNFYDSPLDPFRVSCDVDGQVVIWGRVPVEAMSGESLAELIDALGQEGEMIREQLEVVDADS